MTKKITLNDVEVLFHILTDSWKEFSKEIKINTKSLYNLIGLKKKVTEIHNQTQEVVMETMMQNDGYTDDRGFVKVPENKIDEVNQKLMVLGETEIEIDYQEIILKESDVLPTEILESIYDFVTLE